MISEEERTQGDRIRALFQDGMGEISIIAPFIKVEALGTLLDIVPPGVFLRCVTRWMPRDIAAGVSDPEILDLLEERGNFKLTLVDRLHAKLYISGARCLVGSANITASGLGQSQGEDNIELLVESTTNDSAVIETLHAIAQTERIATKAMAVVARTHAERIDLQHSFARAEDFDWLPISRNPKKAFEFYCRPPTGFVGRADDILLRDVASANLTPGLSELEFNRAICAKLAAIPSARVLLKERTDLVITRADASPWLDSSIADEEHYTKLDLWRAFVNWMVYFYPDHVMKQEISEIALRRARIIG